VQVLTIYYSIGPITQNDANAIRNSNVREPMQTDAKYVETKLRDYSSCILRQPKKPQSVKGLVNIWDSPPPPLSNRIKLLNKVHFESHC